MHRCRQKARVPRVRGRWLAAGAFLALLAGSGRPAAEPADEAPWPAAHAQFFPADGSLELGSFSGAWRMHAGDAPAWASPDLDDRAWPRGMMGARMSELGLAKDDRVVWLRRSFYIPERAWTGRWTLAAAWGFGRITLYINGLRIARTSGKGPWQVRIPAAVLHPGRSNSIALRLERPHSGDAGFTTPSLRLRPLTAADLCPAALRRRPANADPALFFTLGPADIPIAVKLLLQSYDLRLLADKKVQLAKGERKQVRLAFTPVDSRRMHAVIHLFPSSPGIRPGRRDFFPRCAVRSGPRRSLFLNGTWQAARDSKAPERPPASPPRGLIWKPYPVPHWDRNPFKELRPAGALWFRRNFRRPGRRPAGTRWELVFGAVRYRCDIYLNRRLLGTHSEGYSPFRMDITDRVRDENQIAIRLCPLSAVEDSRGRRRIPVYYPPAIWQDVRLVTRPAVCIRRLWLACSLRPKRIRVWARVRNDGRKGRQLTLRFRVRRGGATLPPVRTRLAPGRARVLESEGPWWNARLYQPGSPNLYVLEARLDDAAGRCLDRRTLRFGFREIRRTPHDMLYNGARFVLRKGPWAPGGRWIHTPEQVYAMMRSTIDHVYGAVRFHHSPPPPYYLDMADLAGVPVEEESAVFGSNYAWESPRFRSALRNHWLGLVRRDRNHPSVVLYSIDNESYWGISPQGIAPAPGLKTRVAAILDGAGKTVRREDPTRPVNFEGDGDLGGRAAVCNLHYPNWISADPEFPARTRRPLDARGKPLIVGEFAYELTVNPPRGVTSLMGRAARRGGLWRMGWNEAVREFIEGYKLTGIDGYSAWNTPRVGTDPPLCIIMDSYCRHAWSGERRAVVVWLGNSTLRRVSAALDWRLYAGKRRIQQGRILARLLPNRPARACLHLAFPASAVPRRRLVLELRLRDKTGLRYRTLWPYYLYARPRPLPQSTLAALRFFAPPGSGSVAFRFLGRESPIRLSTLTPSALAGARGLVVAPHCPPALLARAGPMLEAFARAGGRVVFLEQTTPPACISTAPPFAPNYSAALAFPAARPPAAPARDLWQGLDAEDLRWWRPDGRLTESAFFKMGPADPGAIVECGGGLGLVWTPLALRTEGSGAFLFCQLLAAAKAAADPAAARLVRRLLVWAGAGRKAGLQSLRKAARQAHPESPPMTAWVLPAASAVVAADEGVRTLGPIGRKTGQKLVALRDPGDAVAFRLPPDCPPGAYRLALWVRTGEKAPLDRVKEYEIIPGTAKPQTPEPDPKTAPLFSHRGGDWAVWYGYIRLPGTVRLRPGARIVVRARASWLYVGAMILEHPVAPSP